MFDIATDRIDSIGCASWAVPDAASASPPIDEAAASRLAAEPPTFRTLAVLLIETAERRDGVSIVEQCLRYMIGFECVIAQAGSLAAGRLALQLNRFDVVVADERSLELIGLAGGAPTIVVADRASTVATRDALAAGAQHCLPIDELSPRLLEIAIAQTLSNDD